MPPIAFPGSPVSCHASLCSISEDEELVLLASSVGSASAAGGGLGGMPCLTETEEEEEDDVDECSEGEGMEMDCARHALETIEEEED
ncbi:hypothetical protein HDU96_010902 [Phlyctochytrium bullatum]|nr:hypothetical protein HDU96_010902 [Phlyctochytrium bullatum]